MAWYTAMCQYSIQKLLLVVGINYSHFTVDGYCRYKLQSILLLMVIEFFLIFWSWWIMMLMHMLIRVSGSTRAGISVMYVSQNSTFMSQGMHSAAFVEFAPLFSAGIVSVYDSHQPSLVAHVVLLLSTLAFVRLFDFNHAGESGVESPWSFHLHLPRD